MRLQLTLVTTGVATCTFAGSAYTSPISSSDSAVSRKIPDLFTRGISEWGIGHYGGTVSEILMDLAKELENADTTTETDTAQASVMSIIDIAFPTITAAPTSETAAPEPIATTDESTSWTTTTITATVYVTRPPSTVTAAPTETPAAPTKKAKREELPLQLHTDTKEIQDQIAEDPDELDQLIMELNQFFLVDAIAVGDPCAPVTESENKICIESEVAICREGSRAWEVDLSCNVFGMVCGAVKARDFVHGGWKADIRCLG